MNPRIAELVKRDDELRTIADRYLHDKNARIEDRSAATARWKQFRVEKANELLWLVAHSLVKS